MKFRAKVGSWTYKLNLNFFLKKQMNIEVYASAIEENGGNFALFTHKDYEASEVSATSIKRHQSTIFTAI